MLGGKFSRLWEGNSFYDDFISRLNSVENRGDFLSFMLDQIASEITDTKIKKREITE